MISSSFAILLNKRRIIFPDLVFGKLSPNLISSGLAIGPISFPTQALKFSTIGAMFSAVGLSDFKTTKAIIDSPFTS